ncbi:copper resistance protein CopC [Corynebacterium mucifaciens]|nr:copper resistance protein CopC [Corynebacterium mucifaciens]
MLIPAAMRRATVVAAAAAGSLVAAAPALAHDSVVGAVPEDSSVVHEFPDEVTLEFSGEVQEGFNTVAVSREVDGQSEVVYSGEPAVEGRLVTLDVPGDVDAQPGEYTVGYQIVSSDGHATKGVTSFTFAPDQAPAEENQAAGDTTEEPASDDSEGMGTPAKVLLALLGVLVIGGAAAAALARGRRNPATARDEAE